MAKVMDTRSKLAVLLIAVSLLSVGSAGCLSDDDEPIREMEFTEYEIYSVDANGAKLWTIELSVSKELMEGVKDKSWDLVSVVVSDTTGQKSTDELPAQPNPETLPEGLGVYYVEVSWFGPGHGPGINVNDRIEIVGLDEEYKGGVVKVLWKGEKVSEFVLPGEFVPVVDISFDDPVVDPFIIPSTVTWTYDLKVKAYGTSSDILHWHTLAVGLQDPSGNVILGPMAIKVDPGPEGYDNGSDGTVGVEAWSIDTEITVMDGGRTTTMDVGDAIRLSGLTRAHEGALVVLYKGEDPIWTSAPIGPLAPPVVGLGDPAMWSQVKNETLYFNASFPVTGVTPANASISWDSVRVVVTDDKSDELMNVSVAGQDPGGYCRTRSAFFDGISTSDGNVTVGESLVLKGLTLFYRGATVKLVRSGETIGEGELPSVFGLSGMRLSTSSLDIEDRVVGEHVVYDLTLSVRSYDPYKVPLPWEDIEVRVVDRESDEVLLPLTNPDLFEGVHSDVPTVLFDSYTVDNVTDDTRFWIILSALNETFEGAWLELYLDGQRISEEWLPTPFNLTNVDIVINLAYPDVTGRTIDGTACWYAVLNINKLTPSRAIVNWSDLRIKAIQSTGSVLVHPSALAPDTGAYDEDGSDGIDVELWYVETTGNEEVGAGDAFKLTGLPQYYEGATLEFYLFGDLVGSVTLPPNFP
jgi:hypothetical protein